jgi:hypothetical protein
VEDAEDVYFIVPTDIRDAVVTPKEDADFPPRRTAIHMTDFREFGKDLGAPIDRLDDPECGSRPAVGDVVVNTAKPYLRFASPNYFRQDSIRRPISW